jgi:hypothetical protein
MSIVLAAQAGKMPALPGRYFVLNPTDASVKTSAEGVLLTAEEVKRLLGEETSFMGPALVGFCPQGDIHRVCALAKLGGRPVHPAQHWSRARLTVHWEDHGWRGGKQVPEPGYRLSIDLALDRFFLPNRATLPARENEPGWEVEVCHRPGLTPLPRRLLFKGQPVFDDDARRAWLTATRTADARRTAVLMRDGRVEVADAFCATIHAAWPALER